MEVFPADEVIVSADETMIFDVLKVEEPDIVIVDGDIETLDLKPLCRKIKQYPVVIILLLGEKDHGKDVMHNANLFINHAVQQLFVFHACGQTGYVQNLLCHKNCLLLAL